MTSLIRGFPDSLKAVGIQLQGEIRNTPASKQTLAVLEAVLPPYRRNGKVWTWGQVPQKLINYSWETGPPVSVNFKAEPKLVRQTE